MGAAIAQRHRERAVATPARPRRARCGHDPVPGVGAAGVAILARPGGRALLLGPAVDEHDAEFVAILARPGGRALPLVWTDAPLGAVGGAVLLAIVSNILDAVTALGDWRDLLPTHYQFAWTRRPRPEIVWDSMARGALWSAGYSLVLFAFAWRHFLRKDITS